MQAGCNGDQDVKVANRMTTCQRCQYSSRMDGGKPAPRQQSQCCTDLAAGGCTSAANQLACTHVPGLSECWSTIPILSGFRTSSSWSATCQHKHVDLSHYFVNDINKGTLSWSCWCSSCEQGEGGGADLEQGLSGVPPG